MRTRFSHSVCFDVYVEGSTEVIDFEIQCSSIKGISKRAREYQANMDVEQLSKGKPYSSLKESWIVFFCTFEPFGQGLPMYTVRQSYEEEHETKYDDGTNAILWNEYIPIIVLRGASVKRKTRVHTCALMKYTDTQVADSPLAHEIAQRIEDEREKALQTARGALECGIPADTVAKFMGLSVEEVRSLE